MKLRLGVNIDHVATLRNARGGKYPDPIRAALVCKEAGADGVTAHLREDRRHIKDADIERLKKEVGLPLNLEMAATEEMLNIALKVKPNAVCLVPEKRAELTTEGGLDVVKLEKTLKPFIKKLKAKKIRVSLFISPDKAQVEAAARAGADIVELHTGAYAHAPSAKHVSALLKAAELADHLRLEVHAGHGLNYDNVTPVAAIPYVVELNIGHFLVGEALFLGLRDVVQKMRHLMHKARV